MAAESMLQKQILQSLRRPPVTVYQEKGLTPNPDLFNCIFYKLFGVPKEMNTSMLALGRIAGWVANFVEHLSDGYPLTRPCDI